MLIERWQRDGVPVFNMTGLNTTIYANLRNEGYTHSQISGAAHDISRIRGFTPQDVNHYTPFFAGTDRTFRNEARNVIESNGRQRFRDSTNVTQANIQAELTVAGRFNTTR